MFVGLNYMKRRDAARQRVAVWLTIKITKGLPQGCNRKGLRGPLRLRVLRGRIGEARRSTEAPRLSEGAVANANISLPLEVELRGILVVLDHLTYSPSTPQVARTGQDPKIAQQGNRGCV